MRDCDQIRLHFAESEEDFRKARMLFLEYAASLDVDLCFQGFDQELEAMHVSYNLPHGALLLALKADEAIGCVAIRPFQTEIAEMKRMYIKPFHRRSGTAKKLLDAIIHKAADLGYLRIRLDTLPEMHAAQKLYRAAGFKEITPYRFNPVEGTVYMEFTVNSCI